LQRESALLRDKWKAGCSSLDTHGPRPPDPSLEAVQQGRAAWQAQLHHAEQACTLIQHWITCLEEANPWPAHLRDYANVVAGTTSALAADAHFREAPAAGPGFDLLVLQEADQITEAEFAPLAGYARRWVLVGEPAPERGAERTAALRKPRSPTVRARLFETLWGHLHWEPRGLRYAWVLETDRLCCQLQPVAPDQRQWLETEAVADFPDVELRILNLPRTQPQLVEVVFPPSLSTAEAKAYIYKELEELAVQTTGRSACWVEDPGPVLFPLNQA